MEWDMFVIPLSTLDGRKGGETSNPKHPAMTMPKQRDGQRRETSPQNRYRIGSVKGRPKSCADVKSRNPLWNHLLFRFLSSGRERKKGGGLVPHVTLTQIRGTSDTLAREEVKRRIRLSITNHACGQGSGGEKKWGTSNLPYRTDKSPNKRVHRGGSRLIKEKLPENNSYLLLLQSSEVSFLVPPRKKKGLSSRKNDGKKK